MRFLAIWLAGFVLGVPLGFMVRSMAFFMTKRDCLFISTGDGTFKRCPGLPTKTCIMRLCPVHCKELHGTKCADNYYLA